MGNTIASTTVGFTLTLIWRTISKLMQPPFRRQDGISPCRFTQLSEQGFDSLQENDVEMALSYFNEALLIKNESDDATARRLRKIQNGINFCQSVNLFTHLRGQGLQALSEDDSSGASSYFNDALSIILDKPRLVCRLPQIYSDLEHCKAIGLFNFGRKTLDDGDTQEAEDIFLAALAIATRLNMPSLEQKLHYEVNYCHALKLKAEGNKAFEEMNYQRAIDLYTSALNKAVGTKLMLKLYLHRSEAYSKQGEHAYMALEDATQTYTIAPETCYKGYFRAATVLKDMNKPKQALTVLRYGLTRTDPPLDIQVKFLVEIVLINTHQRVHDRKQMKQLWFLGRFDAAIWRYVFRKLAAMGKWVEMNDLILDKTVENLGACGKDVDVVDLIKYCSLNDRGSRIWGQTLAAALMERGSTYPKNISVKFMKSALDFGIDTGKFELLKYVFENHVKSAEERNKEDDAGENLSQYMYLIVSYRKGEETTLKSALEILSRHGIDVCHQQFGGSSTAKIKTRVDRIRDEIQRRLDNIELEVSDHTDDSGDDSDESDDSTSMIFENAAVGGNGLQQSPRNDFRHSFRHVNPQSELNDDDIAEAKVDDTHDTNADECSSQDDYDDAVDLFDFNTLEWEIECSKAVMSKLCRKSLNKKMKTIILKKIQLIGSGDFVDQPHLMKKLTRVPPTIKLYEAKITKAARLIWEIGIAFSPGQSDPCSITNSQSGSSDGNAIYSEVIRLWDIVLNHGHLYRSVRNVVKSHERGEECHRQAIIKAASALGDSHRKEGERRPRTFRRVNDGMDGFRFVPPASSKETEYHIMKWYAFDSAVSAACLRTDSEKIVFPFKATDIEYEVIVIEQKPPCPLLLLGRSGTGKTTVCLYRMWARFVRHLKFALQEDPLISKTVLSLNEGVEDHQENQVKGALSFEQDTGSRKMHDQSVNYEPAVSSGKSTGNHLNQLFITKNPVLCDEIKENFKHLSLGCPEAQKHVRVADELLPNRLQQVDPHAYPLFLTSKQFLVILDASLPEPHFFPRNTDGSPKQKIAGHDEGKKLAQLAFNPEMCKNKQQKKAKDGEMVPMREVTYEIFADELWPQLIRQQNEKVTCHPSLVWAEIHSFIKGSIEALDSKSGCVDLDVYSVLGRKRAPNFQGRREQVYKLFLAYSILMKQRRWVDETDIIFNLYNRLKKHPNPTWILHEIYVDETQDFTQAELALLIRCCQDPNNMFLTGDTAQGIMRGISFRFEDLKSLFYYARESDIASGNPRPVGVPQTIYKLIYNYRSHTGILNLATSLLDLIDRFFPASYDRLSGLEKDRGLFDGPKPVLVDCSSYNDLVGLLRGNTRNTSPIEFGAHQAIIVADDRAKNDMPKEFIGGLVLTIYESKGLEFDDILLYNFFKDSQAKEEWRVVLTHLEEMYLEQESAASQENAEELIEINIESAREDRPRRLNFDYEKHKILNSELKHLYTAVTRARVNIWIFDEDRRARAPMFHYFLGRKLVTTAKAKEEGDGQRFSELFPKKSSKRDWKRKGDDFYRRHQYQLAADCYKKAGRDRLVEQCLANMQEIDAKGTVNKRERCDKYLTTSLAHLRCHQYLQAANCLYHAGEMKMAAQLHDIIANRKKGTGQF